MLFFKKALRRFLTRFFCGLFCFSLFPWCAGYIQNKYAKEEPFFLSPVDPGPSKRLVLRKDKNGKGYFGAPRDGNRTHQGIDLTVPVGNPISATKSGRVVFAGEGKGYGKYVDILHVDGLWSRYAHLSAIQVSEGDWVRRGDVIGQSGKTGNAASPGIIPHLHFEIRYHDQPLNPSNGLFDPSVAINQ